MNRFFLLSLSVLLAAWASAEDKRADKRFGARPKAKLTTSGSTASPSAPAIAPQPGAAPAAAGKPVAGPKASTSSPAEAPRPAAPPEIPGSGADLEVGEDVPVPGQPVPSFGPGHEPYRGPAGVYDPKNVKVVLGGPDLPSGEVPAAFKDDRWPSESIQKQLVFETDGAGYSFPLKMGPDAEDHFAWVPQSWSRPGCFYNATISKEAKGKQRVCGGTLQSAYGILRLRTKEPAKAGESVDDCRLQAGKTYHFNLYLEGAPGPLTESLRAVGKTTCLLWLGHQGRAEMNP